MSLVVRSIAFSLGIALTILSAASCTGARRHRPTTEPAGAKMGVYRVTLQDGERTRRFRLLLYVAEPDRIHAEALSPVGRTELILDGGDGQLAVSIPRQRQAFVGDADPEVLARLLGAPLTLEEWVAGLLGGDRVLPQGVSRQPAARQGLPDRLAVERGGETVLELRLLDLRELSASTEKLGAGIPAPGLEIVPLEALAEIEIPVEAEEGDRP